MKTRSSMVTLCRVERSKGVLRFLSALILPFVIASCGTREPEEPAPGPLAVQVQLSTNQIHVGDVFNAHLRVQHPFGSTLRIPDLARGKELVVRSHDSRQSEFSKDQVLTDVHYRLSSFMLGQHVISTGRVECVAASGERLVHDFPFASIEVVSALPGSDEAFRDIKDTVRWPGATPRWLWGLILIAIAAALAGFAARQFLSKPRTFLHFPPPEPPHETALRRLRALKARGWIEAMNVEPFYVELSAIVRQYIENRFNLRAPEMTTEEFIREAAGSRRLNDEQQKLTAGFLEQADLVKFARYQPERADMESAFQAAETLVLQTTPHPVQEDESIKA